MVEYDTTKIDYFVKHLKFKQFLFLIFIIIFPIQVTCENFTKNHFVREDEIRKISHDNNNKLVQLLIFYDAKEFNDDKNLVFKIYIHRVIKAVSELLYPLNIYLTISDYIKIKNISSRIGDITHFKNLYTVMNHDALPAHNLAMIVSEFPKSTHAYRRGFCSDVYQNIISARIHLKEFNDHFLIRDAEEIAYSLVSMIGFTMDDEMIIDDFYNCTCLDENLNENINNRCFTIYNNENCLLHRLLHRFGKVDCLHKSYKYFNGFSVDPICGNGVIERGEVCDPGPEIYGVSWSCTNTCQWTTLTIYSFFTVAIILSIFIILLLFAVIYYRCKNMQKRKILKNLSTSVNLLYDQRTTSTSKSKFLAKSGKTIIGDSGTMSSNNTTNSGHSRTIIGLTKDNEIKKFNNEKDSSKIEEKSLNTLPLIIKSSDDVNLSIGTSSEATSNLLNNATTTTANSFTDTLSTSDDLSGVFVTRTKNGRLNQPNHFPKIIKSRKNNNLPSPLASYSSNVDSLPRIVLTGNP